MLDTFGVPTPQGSNYQEFYGGGSTRDWIKPRGVSMVRMLLIGAGAGGNQGSTGAAGAGRGSGAVTEWIGPAIFIPDVLRISIGAGGASNGNGTNTTVVYQAKDGTGYTLLTANGATAASAGAAASSNNFFGASGIFSSTAGQTGGASPSTTTFLSGGANGSATVTGVGANVTCNYGYPTISGGVGTTGGKGGDGFFLTQPIMIGAGGAGGGGNSAGTGGAGGIGGIGCGGGGGARGSVAGGAGGRGGDGAVFIWSW
jgi:hypothetical protein